MSKFTTQECLDIQVRGKLDIITMDLSQAMFLAHINEKFYEEKLNEYPEDRYFKGAYEQAKENYKSLDKLREEIEDHISDIRVYLTDPKQAERDWNEWMGNFDKRMDSKNKEMVKC